MSASERFNYEFVHTYGLCALLECHERHHVGVQPHLDVLTSWKRVTVEYGTEVVNRLRVVVVQTPETTSEDDKVGLCILTRMNGESAVTFQFGIIVSQCLVMDGPGSVTLIRRVCTSYPHAHLSFARRQRTEVLFKVYDDEVT